MSDSVSSLSSFEEAEDDLHKHFFDIPVQPHPGGMPFALAFGGLMGFLFGFVFPALGSIGLLNSCLVIAIPLLTFLTARRFFDRRFAQSLEHIMRETAPPIPQKILQTVFTPSWIPWNDRTKLIARTVRRAGHRGLTGRVYFDRIAKVDNPLDQSFEPIPLNEGNAFFTDAEGRAKPGGTTLSGLIRFIRFDHVLILMVLGVSVVLWFGMGSFRRGTMTPSLIPLLLMNFLSILGIGGRRAWRTSRQWLLIPAGIAVRKAGSFNAKWQLKLFKRANCVLIVSQRPDHNWLAAVAGANDVAAAKMTSREAQMLLRAWLSPLPTPPLEQLSDLT